MTGLWPSEAVRLAFCEGARICPTGCDDDCEDVCHSVHDIPQRREHEYEDCPAVKGR